MREAQGSGAVTETIFFSKSFRLFAFDFGRSESGRDITTDVSTRMWPSLAVALPTFVVGIWVNICVALLVVMFHAHATGSLGRVGLRGADVHFLPVLYHRRPVPGGQDLEAGTHFRVPRRGPAVEVPDSAGAGRRGRGHRFRCALVSHTVPGGGQPGLCAHRPGQGRQ